MANGKNEEDPKLSTLRADRRKNLRKQIIVLKVRGEDDKGSFFGYAKTLSKGGMFISTVAPREAGVEFSVTFTLTGDPAPVKCTCKVVWRRDFNPKLKQEPGMGVRFIDLEVNTGIRIEEWLKTA